MQTERINLLVWLPTLFLADQGYIFAPASLTVRKLQLSQTGLRLAKLADPDIAEKMNFCSNHRKRMSSFVDFFPSAALALVLEGVDL